MEQSAALPIGTSFLDPALRVFNQSDYIPHSGRTVGMGEPCHTVQPMHPVFNDPFLIEESWWRRWSLQREWSPERAQPSYSKAAASSPLLSPAVFGLTLNATTTSAVDWAANDAASRRSSTLLSHSIGLTDLVLVEVYSKTAAGGSALVCGLALAERIVARTEPVADMALLNMLAYIQTPVAAPPHPSFPTGHVIAWGANYSSERGVAASSPSGMLIQPCPYSSTCKSGALGNPACGRTSAGPFTWTSMGHNVDLEPGNASGWSVVHFRTSAAVITTTFLPSKYHSAGGAAAAASRSAPGHAARAASDDAKMQIEVLDAGFNVKQIIPCSSAYISGSTATTSPWRRESDSGVGSPAPSAVTVTCKVADARPALAAAVEHHLSLRTVALKTLVLKTSTFS